MLRYLLDTDHLTLHSHDDPLVVQRVNQEPVGTIGLSVVTLEEVFRGRLAACGRARTGAERLATYAGLSASYQAVQEFLLVEFEQAAEDQFQLLRGMKLKIGTQDLKIAATALANNLVVATRNLRDFGRVPGLTCEDWSL